MVCRDFVFPPGGQRGNRRRTARGAAEGSKVEALVFLPSVHFPSPSWVIHTVSPRAAPGCKKEARGDSCDAMVKWPCSEEPDETWFALAGEVRVWPYLSARPERLRRFADMMRLLSRRPGLEVRHVVDGYTWGDLPDGATVVDVGGVFACAIARAFPLLPGHKCYSELSCGPDHNYIKLSFIIII